MQFSPRFGVAMTIHVQTNRLFEAELSLAYSSADQAHSSAAESSPLHTSDVRQALVKSITSTTPGLEDSVIFSKLAERENQGSTFLNDGVALPHARIEGLEAPQCALGLTHAGVLDAPTDRPIEAVFLLLSPATGASVHLQLLAKVGRALQSRDLRRALNSSDTPEAAAEAIWAFESAAERV